TAELARANEALQAENSERKQAEEALRASQQIIEGIINAIPARIFWKDKNLVYLGCNAAFAHDAGFADLKDIIGKDDYQMGWRDRAELYREDDRQVIEGGCSKLLIEEPQTTPEGNAITLLTSKVPLRDSRGEIRGVIGTYLDITDRKQAEDLLRASEERYRALFESNPSPMWVYDLETLSFLAVNAAAVKHYGYSQGEFRAMTIKDIRPSEDIPALMDDLSQKNDDLNHSKQWRHCTKDRKLIDVEITSHELTWLGRRAKVVLINDITERKRAEETLREQAALFDQTYDAVLVWDWKGPITFWNRGAENLYGYTNGEAVGSTSQQLLNTQVTGGLQTLIESLDRDGVWQGELEHTTSDGRQITVESRMALVREPKREYVLEINRDITERKRGEERLLEQADIINRAHDAIIIRNFDDRRVVFWNRGAERLYGWTAAEVMGEADDVNFADAKEIEKIMSALLSADEFHGEVKQTTKEGKELITEGRATLVRNPDGTPRSVLIICTDVTEQKNLETHLLRAQRLESIGTLASGVAHDLNNILTPILICAEILRENPTEEDAASSIALIEESAKRGANVVKQVLTFARGIEGERVVIKPSHLIQEIIDIAQKTFPKSIEISSRYPEDLWSVEVDPTQLHQVLLNLAVNARDAMPQGGSLIIAAENFNVDEHHASTAPGAKEGPYVLLRVSDTGSGMSRAVIDKIFDPFFTTKKVGKGTGLGLSTAFGIVKSHGGFISVSSEIGRGTSFKIFLPAPLKELPQESGITPESLKGHGELVLLVDDEANILRLTKMALENKNYHVVSASDGREALKIFSEQGDSIKAVLTDMGLPHMDGVALIRAIKKMKPEMVFIASTGQDEENRVSELQALGVSNFLGKPYDAQTLLTKVRDTLAHDELATI
ncbi:MAG TPA: PAS domain S-box protein, partial [Chthoniobacterales bacterium]|nr:PAS domain S-box protein [Chthoniobacterales bacterium]